MGHSKPIYCTGAQDNLSFAGTFLNIGGAWKSAINTVNITVTGTYLVFMDITSYTGSGFWGAKAEIMLYKKTVFWVQIALLVATSVQQMRNYTLEFSG